ncbi:hypothetical protein, conserved [Trypanosoma brucei gambiense DAL972]|uniref:Trypanosoma Tc-38 (p38) protein domain-containing protein n=1 Tax=Trypanosoma brucei gambiense (strain MHOM/CI/86/DAL972) TaxID=679716 RepID=D0AAI7_TRYB9|nr:hypothetical protein, conserved [Trypanosoma brucei gambiense DAL972]CBH18688.1 hypothetical protein, conserved [Trypanosoma brucei gambiense DAL972]|eukprot:XP_011780952.1 hypothetical protein, conserved [Trypanosoma brucei gambiense DAL972]
MRGVFYLTGVLLKRKRLSTVHTEVSVLSSVTNAPFSPSCQAALRSVAKERHYVKRHWLTLAQSRRSCNAVVLPGEAPTIIHLNVKSVIPFSSVPKSVQKRIMDEHPPFFGSGVGILSTRMKWKSVTGDRLRRFLNEEESDRVLYIDTDIASELGVQVNRKDVIDIRKQSSVSVYSAEQLDDPYKGEPQRGITLNAATGKRLGQPAHDILLAVGILRGYTSPMWVAEKQLKHLNLEVNKGCENEGVLAPNMTGFVVSLSSIPKEAQKELLKELQEDHPDAFGYDLYFIYGVNGWEVMRSRVLVKSMAAVNDPRYPYHFVNVRDFGLQKPKYSAFAEACDHKVQLLRGKSVRKPPEPHDEDAKNHKLDASSIVRSFSITVGASRSPVPIRGFLAEDATLRRYYNAVCLTEPHLAVPAIRSIAVLNGKLVGRRGEAKLRAFALKHKLSSPIWVTPLGAKRMGVGIEKKHINNYVLIGSASIEEYDDDSGGGTNEEFYNIDDLVNPDEVLSIFPKSSKSAHFMLDSKWRPVLGKQRQAFLTSLKRRSPLWVTVSECLMSGFQALPEVKPISFPVAKKGGGVEGGHKLYNSQFTTDPVRVIGLATIYTRPQGTTL